MSTIKEMHHLSFKEWVHIFKVEEITRVLKEMYNENDPVHLGNKIAVAILYFGLWR